MSLSIRHDKCPFVHNLQGQLLYIFYAANPQTWLLGKACFLDVKKVSPCEAYSQQHTHFSWQGRSMIYKACLRTLLQQLSSIVFTKTNAYCD